MITSGQDHRPILVTGAAGFLGSNLCRRLLRQGQRVLAVDNLSCGSLSNLQDLPNQDLLTFIEHDICLPLQAEVQTIYNLACPASPVHYQADPVQTTKTCVLGALNMLELAVKCSAPILHASTSEVYGDPQIHPQTEDYVGFVNPIGPRSCYDEGKRCAESLFFSYRQKYGLNIKIARIFNTYGPGMLPNDGRVVSNFIIQALTGQDLTIYGTGSQTRSFCYVDDLIEAMLRFAAGPKQLCGPLNLGNPAEFSVRELADLVKELTNSQARIIELPLPVDDPVRRRPDIARAKAALDWEPKVQLAEGLLATIDYFQRILPAST